MKSSQTSEQSGFESRVGYFGSSSYPKILLRVVLTRRVRQGVCVGTVTELACITSVGSSTEQVVKRISRNVNEGAPHRSACHIS